MHGRLLQSMIIITHDCGCITFGCPLVALIISGVKANLGETVVITVSQITCSKLFLGLIAKID